MGYSIIYDRRCVKLNDGTYILMLQTGSNNTWEVRNGCEVPEKYWMGLHLVNEKAGEISCSLQQMKNRIAEFSTCYDSVAKSRGNFFQSEEELRKYLEGGLKYPFSFEEYSAAGNTFQVSCWDKEKRKIEHRDVYSEKDMKETIKEFVANPDYECVNVKFSGREFCPIKSYGQRQTKEKIAHGYLIHATDEFGNTFYFKQKTPKHLRFVSAASHARIFAKESQAQKYIESLPALKSPIKFSIEEFNPLAKVMQFDSEDEAVAE